MNEQSSNTHLATFAGGCFWCTEAIFSNVKGVKAVTSGYAGGTTENPTYEEVCSGKTGHAEAVQIEFDPESVTYRKLLEIFFDTHDPTTKDRQGNDVGTQYRSAIFYHDEKQKQEAEAYIAKLEKRNTYNRPIETEVSKLETFYPAEEYHQNFFEKNPDHAYCNIVIKPKLEKYSR